MRDTRSPPLLRIRKLHAWYSESHVLHGVDLSVWQGEVVALIGRNGAGKTTTLKAIMGMIERRSGYIGLDGTDILNWTSDRIARAGIAICPEERGIFAALNVKENLTLPPVVGPGGFSIEQIYKLFPNIKGREKFAAAKLSGGEQQMLAIGRILRVGARLLLLDEPSEGLAPVIVQQVGETIRKLKEAGFTVLLVEQNAHFAASVADRFYVLEQGIVAEELYASDLETGMTSIDKYIAV
ncbi:ABC transporter ATP-binding protein [Bradyrhizobium ottawaense]|uniref:ABC transporter ATP-binding protein n=1 Tax=Bradyrhizobium ottawaense TaxID=931866 RepID=UPI003833E32D